MKQILVHAALMHNALAGSSPYVPEHERTEHLRHNKGKIIDVRECWCRAASLQNDRKVKKLEQTCNENDEPGNSRGVSRRRPLSSWKRPRRGPKIIAASSAVLPPVKWTTPDPAKSTMPAPHNGFSAVADRNPRLLHIACAIIGYTQPDRNREYER